CARNGRGVLATLAFSIGELAPGGGAHQAAEDGTGGIGHVAAATDLFDPGDGAAVVARGGGAIARRRGAVAGVAVARGGATGKRQGGGRGHAEQTKTLRIHLDLLHGGAVACRHAPTLGAPS